MKPKENWKYNVKEKKWENSSGGEKISSWEVRLSELMIICLLMPQEMGVTRALVTDSSQ